MNTFLRGPEAPDGSPVKVLVSPYGKQGKVKAKFYFTAKVITNIITPERYKEICADDFFEVMRA